MDEVDRQWYVGDRLHQLHRPGEIAGSSASGMPALTSSMCAPAATLCERVGFDAAEISGGHLGREDLAPRRVDALADHHEGTLEARHDLAGCGADHVSVIEAILLVFVCGSRRVPRHAAPNTPERSMISATVSSWR